MLTIDRETGLSDKTRGFNIIIDGKKVGKIKEGETFCLQFNDQNNHTLQLKIDWCSSIVQEFNGNEDVCFYCKTCIQTKIQIFLSLFYIFFKAASYIELSKKVKS